MVKYGRDDEEPVMFGGNCLNEFVRNLLLFRSVVLFLEMRG